MEEITGVVERITFHSPDTGYTVARVQTPRAKELTTVVGSFANVQAGQTLKLQGLWKEHPKYGPQFQVQQYHETKPATLTGIEKYLGSGLIKGVGPVTAKRIVAHFQLETLEIIEGESDRLLEVPGIGRKRVKMIQTAWAEQKAIKEVMLFLQGHGVSTTYAVKIYKQYGDNAIQVVTHNPYQLADDIFGIGFLTADKIAQQVGIAPTSKFRYRAGILHTLTEASEQGHCYLPQEELVKGAIAKLTTPEFEATAESLISLLDEMAQNQDIVPEIVEEVPITDYWNLTVAPWVLSGGKRIPCPWMRWWWTRHQCWICSWPILSSRRSPPKPNCFWWGTLTSFPPSGQVMC